MMPDHLEPSGRSDLPVYRVLRAPGVRAVCTTRRGGVSRGPYAGLNLAYAVGDAPELVAENRRRVAEVMGVRLDQLVEAEQVHGTGAAAVGRGAAGSVVPGVDALLTGSPRVWLAIFAADCVPVLIWDPAFPAVAAVHAGWRGAAAGVVAETLRRMREVFGTRPERCRVALGPAIADCCYEVGTPVAEAMEGKPWWPLASRPTGPGRWHLNLREAVRHELAECGVAPHQVEMVPDCTKCRPDLFYSYRRDGVTGRMAACIRLSE